MASWEHIHIHIYLIITFQYKKWTAGSNICKQRLFKIKHIYIYYISKAYYTEQIHRVNDLSWKKYVNNAKSVQMHLQTNKIYMYIIADKSLKLNHWSMISLK